MAERQSRVELDIKRQSRVELDIIRRSYATTYNKQQIHGVNLETD